MRAQQMIAGAAGLDAARAGEARADHAADGADVRRCRAARGVDRLERELLVFGIDQRLHVGERRAGLHGDDQFVRFIGRDRVQRRQIEQRIGRHRLADLALGAMADDLQRLLAGDRRAHHLLDILGVTYFESIHSDYICSLLSSSAKADDPVIAAQPHEETSTARNTGYPAWSRGMTIGKWAKATI